MLEMWNGASVTQSGIKMINSNQRSDFIPLFHNYRLHLHNVR